MAGSAAVLTGLERAQRYPRYWSFVLQQLDRVCDSQQEEHEVELEVCVCVRVRV